MTPKAETRYAQSGDVSIAYQVVGDGPIDLVLAPGFTSHLELLWQEPSAARFFTRLASFARLIRFDKRGTGLSDRVAVPSLEQRIDDIRAVMDAAGAERAALMGISEGGAMCMLFASTYPARTSALVLYASFARLTSAPDYPWGRPPDALAGRIEKRRSTWGTGATVALFHPSRAGDPAYLEWAAAYERQSASPGAVAALMRMNDEIDVRHILPAIGVPTLVIHRRGDAVVEVEHGRHLAERIPNAKYVELPGVDHSPFRDPDSLVDEIEEFVTGARRSADIDRVLATVMFTDIVDATARASALGDRAWRDVLENHHAVVRRDIARFNGREIDTAGDGFLAAFDGPARAVRAASAIAADVRALGLDIRAGLHTGECEVANGKLAGIAVHIGARVAALAQPGEVLVSQTVKDLVVGSGLGFHDRGAHTLKGVPSEWRLYALDPRSVGRA
jgi:pimeloyl-ACP methyl ester carboxylesterase